MTLFLRIKNWQLQKILNYSYVITLVSAAKLLHLNHRLLRWKGWRGQQSKERNRIFWRLLETLMWRHLQVLLFSTSRKNSCWPLPHPLGLGLFLTQQSFPVYVRAWTFLVHTVDELLILFVIQLTFLLLLKPPAASYIS